MGVSSVAKSKLSKTTKKPWVLVGFVSLAVVIAALVVFFQRSQMEQKTLSKMKDVLLKLADAEGKIKERTGEYSLDLEAVWKEAGVMIKDKSPFVFGFQRNCVHKYAAHLEVTNTYEASTVFENMQFDENLLKIKDGVLSFLNPDAEDVECLNPKSGFLIYAVGSRADGNLDIWIVNHERTVANIRPEEQG